MEKQPHNSGDDHERDIPELEQLWSGEIDMTGVVRQDDALVDVIGDAIGEAEASGGEVPEWGARTLARALANERDDPQSGALHHFAVTGRADRDAVGRELAEIYASTVDDEVKEWVNWLGTYVVNLRDDESQTEPASPPQDLQPKASRPTAEADSPDTTEPAHESVHEDQPVRDSSLPGDRTASSGLAAQLTEYLDGARADADARGETIALEDAQTVATMLAGFLVTIGVKDSAMMRLAESGEVDQLKLYDECRQLKAVVWKIPDIHIWVEHLKQYLGQHLSRDNPLLAQGLRKHGDVFRAYLQLPDVDPESPDLIRSFQDVYIGSFTSMRELLDELTDLKKGVEALTEAVEGWGFEGFVTLNEAALTEAARSTWDIVEYQGRLHVFTK